ncbi:MAG: 2,4-diketo-3-deoxy-L-fuconate hydrolase [Halioglobus sp.]|jgi:2-keto-4-pentenoate hydratase/2-oxohepta-3-ene-1,7-dioic acid hydratase in catechol pathway
MLAAKLGRAIARSENAEYFKKELFMKIAKWSMTIVVSVLVLLCLYTWKLSQPIFDEKLDEQRLLHEVKIAPIEQALTFARLLTGEVLLVVGADSAGVKAFDLAVEANRSFSDSLDALKLLGGAQLRALAASQPQTQSYSWAQLGIPINETYPHIAAGTNYREHADEVGHTGDPFVFPKLSRVTGWNADVHEGTRLDFEVELCAIPLTEHSVASPASLGYLICGDYTDRWLLIKEMDIGGPMGPTGFPAGKGGQSRFPVGSLLVVPQAEDFYKGIELKLYLNGSLRQKSSAGEMIWPPHKTLNKALADCKVPYFMSGEEMVVTPSCESVPAGTLLLTGTPGGVMFKVANLWSPLAYLREDDVVVSWGTYVGFMRNKISAGTR